MKNDGFTVGFAQILCYLYMVQKKDKDGDVGQTKVRKYIQGHCSVDIWHIYVANYVGFFSQIRTITINNGISYHMNKNIIF